MKWHMRASTGASSRTCSCVEPSITAPSASSKVQVSLPGWIAIAVPPKRARADSQETRVRTEGLKNRSAATWPRKSGSSRPALIARARRTSSPSTCGSKSSRLRKSRPARLCTSGALLLALAPTLCPTFSNGSLHVGEDALGRLGSGPGGGYLRPELALGAFDLLEGRPAHQVLGHAERLARDRRQVLGARERRGQQPLRRRQLLDQADGERLRRVDRAARVDQLRPALVGQRVAHDG